MRLVLCEVEVALTILKLTEIDRQPGRQTGGHKYYLKYRDICAASKNQNRVQLTVNLLNRF